MYGFLLILVDVLYFMDPNPGGSGKMFIRLRVVKEQTLVCQLIDRLRFMVGDQKKIS